MVKTPWPLAPDRDALGMTYTVPRVPLGLSQVVLCAPFLGLTALLASFLS